MVLLLFHESGIIRELENFCDETNAEKETRTFFLCSRWRSVGELLKKVFEEQRVVLPYHIWAVARINNRV